MAEGPRRGPSALLILFLERSHQHLTKARLGRGAHTRTSLGDALHPKARPAGLRSIWRRTRRVGRQTAATSASPAAARSRSALSVRSHVKSRSSRPKWPYAAVFA